MRALSWSSRCIKYLLFIFNLLFVITGIILISVGGTIHGVYGNYSTFLDNSGYMSTSAFFVATGLIIFIISFFGCCGAVKENFCMTVTFTALLILIFIFELAAGISGYILMDNTKSILAHNLNVTMSAYKQNVESRKTVDILQTAFECCGVQDPSNWTQYLPEMNNLVPLSCCNITGIIGNLSCSIDSDTIHHHGCVEQFGNYISAHAVTLGGVAIGIAIIQLIGIIFSCHLSKQIKQYQSV